MNHTCIVCGSDRSANFIYTLNGMSVCLCARHVGDYASEEIRKEPRFKNAKITNYIRFKIRYDEHSKGSGAS